MSNPPLPPITNGAIPAAAVAEFLRSSGMTIAELMLALIPEAQKFARPQISGFHVGAVALGTSGTLYLGANFEFAGQALSFTVHGEQAATAHAISQGERGIQMLAVSAAPCGQCRQFLYELTTASTLLILLPKTPPTLLTSLLPAAFGPGDLNLKAALMSPQSHGLTLSAARNNPIVQAALDAANASYAPYSFDYAGLALKTRDGSIFTGSLAENVAFNPSVSPLGAAVVSLVISGGRSYSDIVEAVLVEATGSKSGQVEATNAVLQSISPALTLQAYSAQLPSKKKK